MSDKIKLLLAVGVVLVAVIVTFVIFNKSSEDELEDVSEEVVSEQVSEEPSDEKSNKVSVTIYSPNEDADGLITSKVTVDEITATDLLNELANKISLLKGVKELEFKQNNKELDLNLSTEFSKALSSCGTAGEETIMASVVNTFLEAYNATTISIKVNGKVIETGHCVYDKPLKFYEFNNGQKTENTNSSNDSSKKPENTSSSNNSSQKTQNTSSPNNNGKIVVKIYTPNKNSDGFVTSKAKVDKVKPSNLLNEMVKKDPSLKGVRSLGFVQNKDHIEVNLSTEFQDALTKYGSSGEHYLMGSVVNTFLEACKAKTITIKIRGKYIETGHNVYDYPLEFYKD